MQHWLEPCEGSKRWKAVLSLTTFALEMAIMRAFACLFCSKSINPEKNFLEFDKSSFTTFHFKHNQIVSMLKQIVTFHDTQTTKGSSQFLHHLKDRCFYWLPWTGY